MDYKKRGSHARGVYPIQYTSRMETASVKQEEEADTNNSKGRIRNMEEMIVGIRKGKVPNKA